MEEKKSPTLHFGLKWLEQDRARQSTTIHFNCVELPTARFTWLLTASSPKLQLLLPLISVCQLHDPNLKKNYSPEVMDLFSRL